MEKSEALKLLKEAHAKIPSILRLDYEHNERYAWYYGVINILKAAFGEGSDELRTFEESASREVPTGWPSQLQNWHNNRLKERGFALLSIIENHELVDIGPRLTEPSGLPKVFIAHGGETPALSKLKQFINALGVIPIIAEDQPSEGRSVAQQVKWCLDQCDCTVALASKGDIDGQTGEFLPRGNTLDEIGRCQEKFPSRIVYLIESGTKFPSNISEKVRVRFSPQSMDRAFIKVAKELAAFGIIKAVKPE